jgi:hypothetical protein
MASVRVGRYFQAMGATCIFLKRLNNRDPWSMGNPPEHFEDDDLGRGADKAAERGSDWRSLAPDNHFFKVVHDKS